jgi:hypothetical protein
MTRIMRERLDRERRERRQAEIAAWHGTPPFTEPIPSVAPDPPRIGQCNYCPERFLGYQAGEDRMGRSVFMCDDCRILLGLAVSPDAPERIGALLKKAPGRETRKAAARRKADRA